LATCSRILPNPPAGPPPFSPPIIKNSPRAKQSSRTLSGRGARGGRPPHSTGLHPTLAQSSEKNRVSPRPGYDPLIHRQRAAKTLQQALPSTRGPRSVFTDAGRGFRRVATGGRAGICGFRIYHVIAGRDGDKQRQPYEIIRFLRKPGSQPPNGCRRPRTNGPHAEILFGHGSIRAKEGSGFLPQTGNLKKIIFFAVVLAPSTPTALAIRPRKRPIKERFRKLRCLHVPMNFLCCVASLLDPSSFSARVQAPEMESNCLGVLWPCSRARANRDSTNLVTSSTFSDRVVLRFFHIPGTQPLPGRVVLSPWPRLIVSGGGSAQKARKVER